MSAESPTPFVDVSGEDPTRVRTRGERCYGSSAGGGECQRMGLTFDSIEKWHDHRDRHHPVDCGVSGCHVLSAYKRDNSPHSYCYKHIPEEWEPAYGWKRTNTESVVEPPKAEGHIIEAVLPEADDG